MWGGAASGRAAARLAVGVVLGALLLAGCGLKPSTQELVVQFAPSATAADVDAVRAACPGSGQATLEPASQHSSAANRAYPLRYDVTRADERDKAAVLRCLTGKPGVLRVDVSGGDAT